MNLDSFSLAVDVVSTDVARLWLPLSESEGERPCVVVLSGCGWFSYVVFFSTLFSGRLAWSRGGGVCSFSGES